MVSPNNLFHFLGPKHGLIKKIETELGIRELGHITQGIILNTQEKIPNTNRFITHK